MQQPSAPDVGGELKVEVEQNPFRDSVVNEPDDSLNDNLSDEVN